MAGDEDSPTAAGERTQEVPQPADPLGIEAVRRLVQHQQLGLAEQSGGDAQALSHAERIATDFASCRIRQLHFGENLVETRRRDPGRRCEDSQVVPPAACGVVVRRLEHCADGSKRRSELAVLPSVDGRPPARRQGEAEQHAERRRLPGAVRAEKTGDPAARNGEAEVVDSPRAAKTLAEMLDLDHAWRTPAARAYGERLSTSP